MVATTSLMAYDTLDLKTRQEQVIIALQIMERANNREIAEYLGLPINQVTPRVYELRNKGKICSNGLKRDEKTQMMTEEWKITPKEE